MGEEAGMPEHGSLWKHYKGSVYVVIGIATHSETQETMVAYQRPQPCMENSYDPEDGDPRHSPLMRVWVRPLRMWREIVQTPEGPRPRFEEVVNG